MLFSASSLIFSFANPVLAHDASKPLTPEQQQQRAKLKGKVSTVGRVTLKDIPPGLPGPTLTGMKFLSGVAIRKADGGKSTQLNFSSTQDPKAIFEWYEKALRGDGWKVRESENKFGRPEWVIGSKKAETFYNVHFISSSGSKKGSSSKGCSFTVTINQPAPKTQS